MKSEVEVRAEIERVTKAYEHVFTCGPATVDINAPRALMQLAGVARLDALYFVIGEKRPRYKVDDDTKINM